MTVENTLNARVQLEAINLKGYITLQSLFTAVNKNIPVCNMPVEGCICTNLWPPDCPSLVIKCMDPAILDLVKPFSHVCGVLIQDQQLSMAVCQLQMVACGRAACTNIYRQARAVVNLATANQIDAQWDTTTNHRSY